MVETTEAKILLTIERIELRTLETMLRAALKPAEITD